jgi:hypothetical protein
MENCLRTPPAAGDRLLNPGTYLKTLLTIHRRPGNAPGLITLNEHWIGQR